MIIDWGPWALAALGACLLVALLGLAGWLSPEKTWLSAGGIVILIPLAAIGLNRFQEGQWNSQRENRVADALLQASTLPPGTSLRELFAHLARPEWGPLGGDFAEMTRQLDAGKPETQVLSDWEKKALSPGIARAAGLVRSTLETGADVRDVFRQAARDQLETQSVLRERDALVWIQKMTLLFAAGVLVPGILGAILESSSQMDLSGWAEWGMNAPAIDPVPLVATVHATAHAYVVELALLAAMATAILESRKERFAAYALVLIPIAWLVWNFASGGA